MYIDRFVLAVSELKFDAQFVLKKAQSQDLAIFIY